MCDHKEVTRNRTSNGPVWTCTNENCGTLFVPVDSMLRLEQQNDHVLDTVTAVFSATLWDLHERAFEAYGVPHPTEDPLEEAHQHVIDSTTGKCKGPDCDYSPFLGGD